MDGIHDLGGMHGFGAIPVADEGPSFPDAWQGRVFACNLCLSPHLDSNVDRFRFRIECMPPQDYLNASYYERWLASMLAGIASYGLLEAAQVATVNRGEIPAVEPAEVEALPAGIIDAMVDFPTGYERDMSGEPAFQPGDRVRARNLHHAGHSRLPRYVRGHIGTIVSDNGNAHLPDTRAASGEFDMQRLYTVSFAAQTLWGADANPHDSVHLDLWESYLEYS